MALAARGPSPPGEAAAVLGLAGVPAAQAQGYYECLRERGLVALEGGLYRVTEEGLGELRGLAGLLLSGRQGWPRALAARVEELASAMGLAREALARALLDMEASGASDFVVFRGGRGARTARVYPLEYWRRVTQGIDERLFSVLEACRRICGREHKTPGPRQV